MKGQWSKLKLFPVMLFMNPLFFIRMTVIEKGLGPSKEISETASEIESLLNDDFGGRGFGQEEENW